MNKPFNIIQVGFGPMGKIITSLLLKRRNIKLIGLVDINPQLIDKKLHNLIDINEQTDLIIESDLDNVLLREKADVVIIATSSI